MDKPARLPLPDARRAEAAQPVPGVRAPAKLAAARRPPSFRHFVNFWHCLAVFVPKYHQIVPKPHTGTRHSPQARSILAKIARWADAVHAATGPLHFPTTCFEPSK
ncbi:hypothetical protein HUS70_12765 [Pandoraea nosoerga]|uniref:hypothetical protein n=1 Tax=Pandoraea nosoerga TaxID=2508296 RepID=UPI00123F7488|nr:hypothetical protein [Pandoraea nosoerga]MBN4668014.1 hypothetical protein [Pandoraea nosoerga]MBN4675110.1 hypothetical protein [Pandoraea nosoerga]MBN4680427.1 hypothetical protein [Pandoraea nosoerga]MBN4745495.1 hypothetical protein [Pandoraea nosoerga]